MRAFQCSRRSLGQGKKEHDPCWSGSVCLMLEEFRFEECSFCPMEIFIELYKNTTFDLKSPLASLYKHGKCYWALEISFNEGKVFLLKSIIFFLATQHLQRSQGNWLDLGSEKMNQPMFGTAQRGWLSILWAEKVNEWRWPGRQRFRIDRSGNTGKDPAPHSHDFSGQEYCSAQWGDIPAAPACPCLPLTLCRPLPIYCGNHSNSFWNSPASYSLFPRWCSGCPDNLGCQGEACVQYPRG